MEEVALLLIVVAILGVMSSVDELRKAMIDIYVCDQQLEAIDYIIENAGLKEAAKKDNNLIVELTDKIEALESKLSMYRP